MQRSPALRPLLKPKKMKLTKQERNHVTHWHVRGLGVGKHGHILRDIPIRSYLVERCHTESQAAVRALELIPSEEITHLVVNGSGYGARYDVSWIMTVKELVEMRNKSRAT